MLTRAATGIVAVGVVIAGVILWRLSASSRTNWVRNLRLVVAALTAYSAAGFLPAMLSGVGLRAALHGFGLFRFLPHILQATFLGGFVILPLGWIVSLIRAEIGRAHV